MVILLFFIVAINAQYDFDTSEVHADELKCVGKLFIFSSLIVIIIICKY